MSKENSQADEWVCIVLGNPVWFFAPSKRRVTEILMEEGKKLEGNEKCFPSSIQEARTWWCVLEIFYPGTRKFSETSCYLIVKMVYL